MLFLLFAVRTAWLLRCEWLPGLVQCDWKSGSSLMLHQNGMRYFPTEIYTPRGFWYNTKVSFSRHSSIFLIIQGCVKIMMKTADPLFNKISAVGITIMILLPFQIILVLFTIRNGQFDESFPPHFKLWIWFWKIVNVEQYSSSFIFFVLFLWKLITLGKGQGKKGTQE